MQPVSRWLNIGVGIFKEDVISQELNCNIIRCYLEMGKLEEAETEISNITNDINSHLLRIQLNIKRNHLPDAVAMIKQIPKMDGIKAAHLFSLLDTNSELLKLHALRAALIVEPKNRFILRSLFATIAMATELTPSTKLSLFRHS